MNSTKIIVAGIVLWFVAFAVLLVFADQVLDGDRRWLWTCLAGGVLGLLGLALSLRQRRPRISGTPEPAGERPRTTRRPPS